MKTKLRKNRNGTFSVVFKDANGRSRSVATNATQRGEAMTLAKRADIQKMQIASEAGLLRNQVASLMMSGKKMGCIDAANEYVGTLARMGKAPSTVEHTRSMLNQWIRSSRIPHAMIGAVTEDHVNRFVNNPSDKTTVATRRSRLSAVRGFMAWAVECGHRADNPAGIKRIAIDVRGLSHAQLEPKEKQPITSEEYERITTSLEGFWREETMFSYWAGLRLVDICSLEWDQFTCDEVIAWTRKSGMRVALPIKDPALGCGILVDLLGEIPITHHKYVFPRQRVIAQNPKKRAILSVSYGRILKRIGIKGKSFHSLRHSFAMRLKEEGIELSDIARLIGHRNTKTTEIYAQHRLGRRKVT